MSTAGLQFKIMPESPDTNLEEIKEKIKTEIEKQEGVLNDFKEEPVAFGLKAIIVTLALDESKDSDILENAIAKIENISSVKLIDYRRAVG